MASPAKPRLVVLETVPGELKKWHAKAHENGMTLSAFVRSLLSDSRATVAPPSRQIGSAVAALREGSRELAQVGNNLNQLNRLLHSKQIHTTAGQDEIFASLQSKVENLKNDFNVLAASLVDAPSKAPN